MQGATAPKSFWRFIWRRPACASAVHDDGPGIPEAQRAAAAKPFVRLEAARGQNQGGGVGLGLAIAADVARSHGGQLVLGDSAELGGLSAEIRLPQ